MEPGTIIGEYRVDRLLGEGGMAAVYQVWNSGLQRNEALKLLTPHLAHDRAFVERFLQEARTAANLQHPHIATIFAVSPSDAPQPFFTMQLLPGGDLADLLAQQGKLGVSQALPLLEEMADALDYAHSQGVVHRDIKPANILLQTDAARKLHVKLVDFGIARAQESGKTRLTKAGMLMGTPEYMAPEQAGTTDPISGCTDQYALGIVAYEMFCGRPPFPHRPDTSPISVIMSHCNTPPPPPVSLTPELPAEVSAALLRALSKRPQERFGSCGEFVRALKGQAHSVALAVPASYASTPAPASVPAAPARSAPVSWMPIAAITLAAVLGIGLVLNRLNKTEGTDDKLPQKDSGAPSWIKPGPKPGTDSNGSTGTQAATNSAEANSGNSFSSEKPPISQIQVPSLVGLTESAAQERLESTGHSLKFEVGERRHSETTPLGKIISQMPRSSTLIASGSTIYVVISTGLTEDKIARQHDAQDARNGAAIESADVEAAITKWKSAWETLDFPTFISSYSSSGRIYTNRKWVGFSEFAETKRRKFASGGDVHLDLGPRTIKIRNGSATATFRSNFRSWGGYSNLKNFSVVSQQTLEFFKDSAGRWVIVRDESH